MNFDQNFIFRGDLHLLFCIIVAKKAGFSCEYTQKTEFFA